MALGRILQKQTINYGVPKKPWMYLKVLQNVEITRKSKME